jgi:hypothetical protein
MSNATFCYNSINIKKRASYRETLNECVKITDSVPYVKVYRYNPINLYPILNGYGDNGQRILNLLSVYRAGKPLHSKCRILHIFVTISPVYFKHATHCIFLKNAEYFTMQNFRFMKFSHYTYRVLKLIVELMVCKSVHRHIVHIHHHLDAPIFQFIILMFVLSSTCFGRFPKQNQQLNDCCYSL